MSNNKEINITITSLSGATETIALAEASTSLLDLTEFAVALLGISNDSNISLLKDGRVIFTKTSNASSSNFSNFMLKDAGLKDGDLILISESNDVQPNASRTTSSVQTSSSAQAPTPAASGMALDFSSLLNSPPAPSSNNGLTFNIPSMHTNQFISPIEWEGMTLDDAMSKNPNPDLLMKILFNETKHPHLLKELNHHNPLLARKLREVGLDVSFNMCERMFSLFYVYHKDCP